MIALFDNDAAAIDGLRNLAHANLPANVALLRYPDLDVLRDYPTLGPPTLEDPAGAPSRANVNGFGASIELYLGADVLTDSHGQLRPVQWRSFVHGISRYQGEVIRKREIHEAFRAKVRDARANPQSMKCGDWTGIDAILRSLLTTFGDHPAPIQVAR